MASSDGGVAGRLTEGGSVLCSECLGETTEWPADPECTRCDSCGCTINVTGELAAAHRLVGRLRYQGPAARLVVTLDGGCAVQVFLLRSGGYVFVISDQENHSIADDCWILWEIDVRGAYVGEPRLVAGMARVTQALRDW